MKKLFLFSLFLFLGCGNDADVGCTGEDCPDEPTQESPEETPNDDPVEEPTPKDKDHPEDPEDPSDPKSELVYCDEDGEKVLLCHMGLRRPIEVCISEDSRLDHLEHGDYDGKC